MVKLQAPLPLQSTDQPPKVELVSGVAVRATVVPDYQHSPVPALTAAAFLKLYTSP